jgi:hypothetical protein
MLICFKFSILFDLEKTKKYTELLIARYRRCQIALAATGISVT